ITGKGNDPYCSLSLPWPTNIWPLRVDTITKLSGQTLNDNSIDPSQLVLPTVYVLNYQITAGSSPPTFSDSFGKPHNIQAATDGVMRLHLFAEAPDGGDPLTPNMALDQLRQMFTPPLQLQLPVSIVGLPTPIDPSTNLASVQRCEERSIGELAIPCSELMEEMAKPSKKSDGGPWVGTAGHPRNCMAVLITKS
ncbi:MAG TPA: hypothetical protein VI386_36865, partial [Candidatus Sulfotelmatobacter sp.]